MSNESLNTFVNIDNFKEELAAIQNSVVSSNSGVSPIADTDSLSSITLTDEDICFEVDADNRTITIPAEYKNIGVYNDHNAQKIYMRVNRYFDDVDLTTKICVVLFVNPRGVESYSLTNVYTDGTDNEKIIAEWTITHEHTERAGTLTFALCFYHINNEDGVFDYRWSTIPTTGNILYGLDLVKGEFSSGGYDDLTIVVSMIEQETEDRIAADEELESKIAGKVDSVALEAKADKSYNSGFIGGNGARLNGVGGAAIGYNAQASSGGAAGNTSKADEGGAVGYGANTNHGGAVGKDAQSMHGGAVGRNAVTRLGAAIGDGAQTVDEDGNPITAIQLGTGVNNEENTAKFFDYTIMNADGTIPHERIPMSINRYDVSALPSKSQTYDFSDGVSKFIAVERMDVTVESETQVMMSAANAGNKYGLAQFDFGSITDGATRIIAEYDTKYDGGRWEISLVDMSKRPGTSDKSSYDTAGVAFHTGTRDANNNFYLNGDNKYDTTLNNVWVHIRADIDLTAGTLKYEASSEGTLKYSGEIAVPESVGTIDGLEIYTWAQGTIYADNIKINALYDVDENGLYVTDEGQYIYKDGEPVRVGFDDLSGYYTKDEIDEATTELSNGISEKIGKNDEVSVEISSGLEVVSTVWGALESGLRADDLLSSKVNKSDVYTKTQIDTKLGDKSDKPDVTDYLESGENLSVTMTDNNIATCPEVSTLSITMPTSYDVTYCSELSFSSGATPTALTYPESVVMIGVDCIDNVFAPVANKRYTLMTAYNGQSFVGYVTGYDISV